MPLNWFKYGLKPRKLARYAGFALSVGVPVPVEQEAKNKMIKTISCKAGGFLLCISPVLL